MRCWIPDRGATEEDGREIKAQFADEAAAHYAEHCCGFNGDPFNEIVVHVRNDFGALVQVTVTVEAIPYFRPHSIKDVDE